MKHLRSLLKGLLIAAAGLAVLVSIAFLPVFQTWMGELALARQPDLHGSIGSLSVGPTAIEIEDLRLKVGPAVLTIPSLQAKVRMSDWLPGRTVRIQELVAKGWTLDFSHQVEAKDRSAGAGAEAGADAEKAASPRGGVGDAANPTAAPWAALPGWLARCRLPRPVSLDGLDAAGEIRLGGGGASGADPIRVQVSAQGGGLSAQHVGRFTLEASATGPGLPANLVTGRGQAAVTMLTPQTVARIALAADLDAEGGALAGPLREAVRLAVTRGHGGREHYSASIEQSGRHLARVEGELTDDGRRLTGTWEADLRDADLRPFAPDLPSPVYTAAGQGGYAWDLAAASLRTYGRLDGTVSHWDAWWNGLRPLGTTRFGSRFDLTHQGNELRVDAATIEISGSDAAPGFAAELRFLASFAIDERTGRWAGAPASRDWADVSVTRLPLAWFNGVAEDWNIPDGWAAARFRLQRTPGGFALRTLVPATASGVTLQGLGRTLGSGLDLELAATAESSAGGWRMHAAPLIARAAGRTLATMEARFSRSADSDAPVVASGTWSADLTAWAASPAGKAIPWLRGRSATGDFTANLGAGTTLEGGLTVVGQTSGNSLTAHVRAQIEADHAVTFRAPLVLKLGAASTDLSVDGAWTDDAADGRLELSVTGQDVNLEQLRALGTAWTEGAGAGRSGSDAGGSAATAAPPRPLPFWGGWVGRAAFALARVRTGSQDYTAVGGSLEFDHGTLRLKGGRGELPPHRPLSWDGAISFDGAAYALTATAGSADVDAAALIPARKDGEDPIIEGHFSVARSLTGTGRTLTDLLHSTRATIRLKSSDGIIRWFKTNVGDAITQASTPATDALGSVGSAVGSLFGVKRGTLEAVKNPLSPTAEAVLEFSNQVAEFGYDSLTATAVEQPDGSFRVTALELKAPAEEVTGAGTFGGQPGRPLSAQPLALDLQFGARGRIGKLLAQGGLARPGPAAADVQLLAGPVHFGGTLGQLDTRSWHDLLARAAKQPPRKKS